MGHAWTFTDVNGYNANWAYTAQVISSAGGGAMATQVVTLDNTEPPPVIKSVIDSADTSILHTGSTIYAVSTVSGTGNAGSTIYLYDNTSSNLVGTTTVGADGNWSMTNLTSNLALGTGSNTFYARQVDAAGNASVLSNAWTVSSSNSGNQLENGDLSLGTAGAPAALTYSAGVTHHQLFSANGFSYTIFSDVATLPVVALNLSANYGTTTTNGMGAGSGAMTYQINYANGAVVNPGGRFSGEYFGFNAQSAAYGTFWSDTVDVVAGQTYNFSLDFVNWNKNIRLYIGNSFVDLLGTGPGTNSTSADSTFAARGWGTFTATTTGTLALELRNVNGIVDFQFDNLYFGKAATPTNGTLAAGATPPFTASTDGASTAITYTGGMADMLAGDDVLNVGTNAQTLLGTAGNLINGNTGIDTLKLATGTTLDLTALTNNQTVKPIQQVEVFELQGGSTLTLSANSVLSLGAKDAFSGTAGKVQLLIKGQSTDNVVLQNLKPDGAGGNTGLSGIWTKEASTVNVSTGPGAGTYNVYTHSTTGAQVLISSAVPDNRVTLSTSPLVIDLNGDGVQTTTLADGVLFDLLGAGSTQATAWVDRHDGLLAIDLNGDGVVNSGAELLGNSTRLADGSLARDGWQALAQYDANADGLIDAQDAVFGQLRVWVDADTDGLTDAGELRSLAVAGIQSISLQRDGSQTEQNGNILDGLAAVEFADGRTTQMTDVWFSVQQPGQESRGEGQDLDALQHASDVAVQALLDQQMMQLQSALREQEAQKYL